MKLAATAFACLLAGPALAQGDLRAGPASNESCVKLLPGAPVSPTYPAEKFDAKQGELVRVELEFVDAASPPRVRPDPRPRVDYSKLFFEAIEQFARSYRNTCMKPGDPPVRILQDFSFTPNDGRKVTWTVPLEGEKPGQDEKVSAQCVTHLKPGSKPEFPARAFNAQVSGRVVVQLEFQSLNQPPKARLPVPPVRRDLGQAVMDWVEGYRLTCGETPLKAFQVFSFIGDSSKRPVLRDAQLLPFLGGTRNFRERPVYFDLNSMGCPFDARLRYWQPYLRNEVGEVGPSRAERRTFLDWLAGLQLNIDDRTAAELAGEEMTITIPCGTVDL